ncbi:unnamed protein product [Leptidea sinapis]|uniref:Uncharacterized protein n=1 Tax=Leptidea sinapis TaxID=189913 RepID=A0A5E4R0N4_9NEOP|nr:unnamed protein product [Leptidea sinapis]
MAENQQSREKIKKCNVALEQKVHEFEQASLNNRIEIMGIEKLPGENLKELISKVGDTINVNTSEIEWARRVTTTRPLKTSAKPAPIVVKFKVSGANSRDTWLAQRRKMMEVTSDKLTGGSATNKIYINEALTKVTRTLLWNTKKQLYGVYNIPGFDVNVYTRCGRRGGGVLVYSRAGLCARLSQKPLLVSGERAAEFVSIVCDWQVRSLRNYAVRTSKWPWTFKLVWTRRDGQAKITIYFKNQNNGE